MVNGVINIPSGCDYVFTFAGRRAPAAERVAGTTRVAEISKRSSEKNLLENLVPKKKPQFCFNSKNMVDIEFR